MGATIKQDRASLLSQLGEAPCNVEDTEEMFWLREADDYESRFQLGNALARQYRFREAVQAYQKAARVRADDWKLFYSLAGAELTLRHFERATVAYHRCLALGAGEKAVAYPLGIACYLQKQYKSAADYFAQCLPCGDEMKIAVLYWHTLACYRAGEKPELLGGYHADMQVGHHTAYRLAVAVFCGEISWEKALAETKRAPNSLNDAIALYGLCGFLTFCGERAQSKQCRERLLANEEVWPCISYLAAWNDCLNENSENYG